MGAAKEWKLKIILFGKLITQSAQSEVISDQFTSEFYCWFPNPDIYYMLLVSEYCFSVLN